MYVDETKIINNVNVNNVSYGFSLDGNHNNFDAIIWPLWSSVIFVPIVGPLWPSITVSSRASALLAFAISIVC